MRRKLEWVAIAIARWFAIAIAREVAIARRGSYSEGVAIARGRS